MKHYILKLLRCITLFIILIVSLVWLIPIDKNNYLMAYKSKTARLITCPTPRIVFIGGSNLAFGLDSHMIEDSLHCHVVNMGLHGGIGIRYPVENCLKYNIFLRKSNF